MSSVVDIRVRNTKKSEKDFRDRYSAISFPDATEILSDRVGEQMMMDGFVSFRISKYCIESCFVLDMHMFLCSCSDLC
jgi:hypothetical protein